jgi:hypothetical protein
MLATLAPVVSPSARAAESGPGTSSGEASKAPPVRGLSPEQLSAVRRVGRNVLAAKKSGDEDGADAVQLDRLRAAVDALIAADLDPRNRMPISVQGQETGEQSQARERLSRVRASARADARALAAQVRRRGEIKAAQARGAPETDTRSAGLPIGEQRARLFERWASKLDAALADDDEGRVGQLLELRDQLRPTKGMLSEAPVTPGTPMLRAMPADYVPPSDNAATR